jgi:hypothetical protein
MLVTARSSVAMDLVIVQQNRHVREEGRLLEASPSCNNQGEDFALLEQLQGLGLAISSIETWNSIFYSGTRKRNAG